MAHYDCDDCGAGMFQDHSAGCGKRVLDAEIAKKILQVKAPPLGLVPRSIANNLRMKEIILAMNRYVADNKKIPSEWINELVDLNDYIL